MDGISRSCGWDKQIPQGVLLMEQLVLSDKWARKCSPRSACLYRKAIFFLLVAIMDLSKESSGRFNSRNLVSSPILMTPKL